MTTIAGFIDGILDGTIPPEKQDYYCRLSRRKGKTPSRLVRTMLDLSKIDSGELKLRPARFDLSNTIVLALLSFEKNIEDKNIEIRGLEDSKPDFIDGDPDMIHQVLYNSLKMPSSLLTREAISRFPSRTKAPGMWSVSATAAPASPPMRSA